MSLSNSLRGLFAKPYEQIHPLEAKSRIDAGALPVDVREPAEWQPATPRAPGTFPSDSWASGSASCPSVDRSSPCAAPGPGPHVPPPSLPNKAVRCPTFVVACAPGPPADCRWSPRAAVPGQ